MSMVIKKYIRHLLLFVGICPCVSSCVDDVDFSTAYEKTVVVECFLNNQSDIQTLKLYFSSDGLTVFSPLPEDTSAELYQNGTCIGNFTRQDSFVWQLPLALSLGVEDTYGGPLNIRRLSWETSQYELLIKVEGKTVTSKINMTSGTIDSFSGGGFVLFASSDDSNLWLCNLNTDREIYKSWPSQLDKWESSIILLHDEYLNRNSHFEDFNRMADDTYFLCAKALSYCSSSGNNSRMLIASEEYDMYLKSYITKKMEEEPDNPAKQMNEYKLFTNINGGTGIFALYFVYNHLPPPNLVY